MEVTATATRAGGWWAIEVDVAGGIHTQARRLDQVAEVVADAVALVQDVPAEDVTVTILPRLPEEDEKLISEAKSAAADAAAAATRASALSRQAAARLRAEGLPVRDVGGLLGVSPQRVSQLAGH